MKKTMISIIISSLMAVTLTGCNTQNTSFKNKTTTLSIWHVYGSQTESPMNDIIDEFNQTVGKENNVVVEVTSISDSTAIDEAIKNKTSFLIYLPLILES